VESLTLGLLPDGATTESWSAKLINANGNRALSEG